MHANMLRAIGTVVGVAILLALAGGTFTAAPAAAQDEPAKKTAPPNKAEQSLNRGIDAYKKNSLARAVGAFSSALSSGGLDTSGTARALYYRGLAYRRQGRTALAITDLTNALWLNNGLNGTERADALENRAAAYKAAGIADPGAPQADTAPAPAVAVNASPADGPTASASAAPARASPQAASPAASSMVSAANTPSGNPPPAATTSSNPLSGIGSFFGNLFSGGSSSPASSQQVASPPPSSSEMTTSSTGPNAVTSSWNSSTQVGGDANAATTANPSKRARTAALKQAPIATDAAPLSQAVPAKGKYKLQLAAVRSRARAEEIVQNFTSKHAGMAGGRMPVIDEAVFGNMGTFYRVNIGPYVSAAEPEKLCNSVRASGFDCLVVTD